MAEIDLRRLHEAALDLADPLRRMRKDLLALEAPPRAGSSAAGLALLHERTLESQLGLREAATWLALEGMRSIEQPEDVVELPSEYRGVGPESDPVELARVSQRALDVSERLIELAPQVWLVEPNLARVRVDLGIDVDVDPLVPGSARAPVRTVGDVDSARKEVEHFALELERRLGRFGGPMEGASEQERRELAEAYLALAALNARIQAGSFWLAAVPEEERQGALQRLRISLAPLLLTDFGSRLSASVFEAAQAVGPLLVWEVPKLVLSGGGPPYGIPDIPVEDPEDVDAASSARLLVGEHPRARGAVG